MFRRKTLVLALAGLITTPVEAAPDTDALVQEIRRLAERVASLEAANQELKAARAPARPDQEIAARLDDVENEVLAIRRQPPPFESLDGVGAGAALTVVVQQADGAGHDGAQVSARADIEVELPMGNIGAAEGRLFGHFRAGDGDGVDTGAFATANATVFGNIPQPVLMQAWYQLDIPVGAAGGDLGRVELTLGKIDPFGFFDGNNIADDESEGFMNLAFVHNPLLDAGGDIGVGEHGASPGLRMAYVSDVNGGDNITASLGLFGAGEGADWADSFDRGLLIGQIEYAGKTFAGLGGAYRFYAWSNGNAVDLAGRPERHTGWGLSIDQQVGDQLTLFTRVGLSGSGEVAFDRALTVGAQLGGAGWGREQDRIGLAYGWADSSAASGLSGAERQVELFYAWQLNDHLALTPDIQWIANPGGDTSAGDVTVWGLRAKAAF